MFELGPEISRDFYALTSLVMGTAILARASAFPSSGLRNRLIALGMFGILHAARNWFPALASPGDGWESEVRAAMYVSSYISLFYFAFGVEDNGVGIAEADQSAVFEAFAQAERDPKRAAKGTGLGLPIVRGLAAAHGGHVRLQSRVGIGTCVTIVLPAHRVLPANRLEAA